MSLTLLSGGNRAIWTAKRPSRGLIPISAHSLSTASLKALPALLMNLVLPRASQ